MEVVFNVFWIFLVMVIFFLVFISLISMFCRVGLEVKGCVCFKIVEYCEVFLVECCLVVFIKVFNVVIVV